MRYEWIANDTPVRGELDARQVADMTAAGMAMAVVREYRCTRGTERHWGEHTQAEVAALIADGWACEVGEPWPMEAPEPPTAEEQAAAEAAALSAQAAELYAIPDCADAVAGVLQRVMAVAALGVSIEDWSFQGVTAAAEAAMASGGNALAILQAAVALRTAWDRIVYHVGDMKTADALWPHFYELAMA